MRQRRNKNKVFGKQMEKEKKKGKYLEPNENKNTTYNISRNTAKAVLWGNFSTKLPLLVKKNDFKSITLGSILEN